MEELANFNLYASGFLFFLGSVFFARHFKFALFVGKAKVRTRYKVQGAATAAFGIAVGMALFFVSFLFLFFWAAFRFLSAAGELSAL